MQKYTTNNQSANAKFKDFFAAVNACKQPIQIIAFVHLNYHYGNILWKIIAWQW